MVVNDGNAMVVRRCDDEGSGGEEVVVWWPCMVVEWKRNEEKGDFKGGEKEEKIRENGKTRWWCG